MPVFLGPALLRILLLLRAHYNDKILKCDYIDRNNLIIFPKDSVVALFPISTGETGDRYLTLLDSEGGTFL